MRIFTLWLSTLLLTLGLLTAPAMATTSTGPVKVNYAGMEKYGKLVLQVANQTGVDPMELVTFISIESKFNPKAKNGEGSSAAGMGAFIDSTWLAMLKTYGKKYGLSMKTRKSNPRANLLMTAEYIKENRGILESRLGRPVSTAEVYTAHLLGPGGAMKILSAKSNRVAYQAARTSPSKNKRYFLKENGKPRTVAEFRKFTRQMVESHKRAYREITMLTAFEHQMEFVTASRT
ncbi:transglycosylase [Erwinia phage PhiEaH1]|uniref:Lytic transglycosylase n=1 Tax=Erwinia phage PhiEaH1 TaxID=1401669 RepID=W8CZD4_9CAUD|nr:transglycosylase [Erwinia phage PhiEaH1]AGX01767.1 lytic transglycosylase [Erwinia phage PhiEaH1]